MSLSYLMIVTNLQVT